MEMKPGQIKDIEKARVGATAEKPIHDIRREEGWSEEEKNKLNQLAERRGEIAMEKYTPEEEEKEKSTEVEERDGNEKARKEMIELIKKSPSLVFITFGIGNVLNQREGGTVGGYGYYFDYKQQKMVRGDNLDFLDSNPQGRDKDKLFVEQWDLHNINGQMYIAMRLPINPLDTAKSNPYLSDGRGGVHMTLAIRFNEQTLSSLGEGDIKENLKHPTVDFFKKLLAECAEEFIPDYYKYVESLRDKWEERKKQS